MNIYSQPVDDGQWHHVACVVKNGIFRVFTDGVPGESTQAKTSLKVKSNLAIGVPNGYKSKPAAPVVLGPIRFSSSARYDGQFQPTQNWSVDGQTVAQFLTKVPFDGKSSR